MKSGPTDGPPDASDTIANVFRDGRLAISEITLRHKAGHRVPVRIRAVAIRNERGAIIGAAETFEESLSASEWNRRQTKLSDYGCLDPTTGILTQDFAESHLRESIATFGKHPVPVSAVCAEIDRLAEVRSKYGPAAIPPVLSVVAQTIENSLRPTDFLGRYREHQFLAVLTECSSAEIDHHALAFVCDTIRMAASGGVEPFDADQMMELDMEVHHHEASEPVSALTTMADSLPGLGIVAAVLGVVITMGALGGPPQFSIAAGRQGLGNAAIPSETYSL